MESRTHTVQDEGTRRQGAPHQGTPGNDGRSGGHSSAGQSGVGQSCDLFGDSPVRMPKRPIALPSEPPELKAARALSAEIRRKRTRRDKQQVAHLICMNLISMLRQGARR